MKRWIVSFTCVLLTSTAWAQSPGTPASPPPAVSPAVQACPEPTKTVCVPEATTKIKVSINYSSTSQQVCLGGCSFFSLFGKCQACEGANCGTPYTKKYLVKKIVTEEVPTVKCIAVTAPACATCATPQGTPPAVSTPAPQPGRAMPSIEIIPVPPVPSKK